MKKRIVITIFLASIGIHLTAQQLWSLEDCLSYAKLHSIEIQEQANKKRLLEIEGRSLRNSRLPTLTANASQQMDFGRSLASDNTYQNTSAQTTALSLSSELLVFSGFDTKYSIKKNGYSQLASEAEKKVTAFNLALKVVECYYQVLFQREMLSIALQQVEQTRRQEARTKVLIENGKIAKAELQDVYAQLATDESSVVEAQNNLQLSLLELAQVMDFSPQQTFDIQPVRDSLVVEASAPIDTLARWWKCRPEIVHAEYLQKAAETEKRVARAGYYPKVSVGAGISTNSYYTSAYAGNSFFHQIGDNLQKTLYVSVSIPLFNRHTTQHKIREAAINVENVKLAMEQTKKTLYKEIEKARFNLHAAYGTYRSAKMAVQANQESFRLVIEKYRIGKSTIYEYNQVKLKLTEALSKQAQAKYSCLMRQKILHLYLHQE